MAGPRRLDGLLTGPLRVLFLPGWLVWRPLIALRNTAYDLGWRPVLRCPLPVVSVGNLASGGTGKTPVAAWVAGHLRERGHVPAVVMRGYGGDQGGNDESRMLEVRVICDRDRLRGAERARSEGATCIVLDDGFQHRRLHRDLDLVLLDALRPWGGGAVLPLGLLREGRRALRRAHALVITRSDQVAPDRLRDLHERLSSHGIPVLRCHHAPTSVRSLDGGIRAPVESLAGRRLLLVSGIGNPDGFEQTVTALGGTLVGHWRYADHHGYTSTDAASLGREAERLGATLLTTAKDAVKLRDLPLGKALVLDIEARFPKGDAAVLSRLLDQACPAPGLPRAPAG